MSRVTLRDLQQRVADDPSDAAACHTLGWAHAARREEDAALGWLERASLLKPGDAGYFASLGRLLGRQQKIARAVEAYRAALMIAPGYAEAAAKLGWMYERLGDADAAADAYVTAIANAPQHPDGYEGLHSALVPGRSADEAAALAAARAPTCTQPLMMRIGLALGLAQHGRYPEAVRCWMSILQDAPEDPLALTGAAEALATVGEIDHALRLLSRALARHPTNVALIVLECDVLSRAGEVDAIRARVRDPRVVTAFAKSVDPHPPGARWWDGTQDLAGKTILMEARGGYGDGLHYGRVLPLLKERGARVLVQGFPQMAALLAALPGADAFVAPFDPCVPYDYHCRLKYVPFLLDWTWDWIGKTVPYVTADPAAVQGWRERFDPRHLNVGLVWRSRAVEALNAYTYRSAPLAAFEPLARVPGITLYGLQVGPGASEVTAETSRWLTVNLEDEVRDFAQAAAAIQALDAVISVDTSMAHLAGALGRPACFVLPRCPDSRWMTEAATFEGRCRWYPSARLYVQTRAGDWGSVMPRMAEDLTRMAASRN